MFSENNFSFLTVILKNEAFANGRKVVKLQKALLCQLPYFEVLLSSRWMEAEKKSVEINIIDENITERCKYLMVVGCCFFIS